MKPITTDIVVTNSISITVVDEIRQEHEACERDATSAVKHAIRAGKLLTEAKAQIGHGGWLTWLAQNVHFSQQTANAYMRIAANYGRSRDLEPSSIDAALKQISAKRYYCPKCGQLRGPSRFENDADRCKGCAKEMSSENTISSAFEIDTPRKRQLAGKAAERLWKVVISRGELQGIESYAETVRLHQAVAVLSEDEIREMVRLLERGMAQTRELRDVLKAALAESKVGTP